MTTKKILSLLVCMCMLISVFATAIPTDAYADNSDTEWVYKVKVLVSNKKDSECGNGKVKVMFEFHDFEDKITLNNTNQKGGDATCEYTTRLAPWMLDEVVFENQTKDGFKMRKIDIDVQVKGRDETKKLISQYPNGKGKNDGEWIQTDDGDEPYYYVPLWTNGRKINNIGNFNDFGTTLYIDPVTENSNTIPYIYNGIAGDQYAEIITGKKTYDCRGFSDEPTVKYTISADKPINDTRVVTIGEKEFEQAGAITKSDDGYGFNLNREKLRVFMNQNNINRAYIKSTLEFPQRSSQGNMKKVDRYMVICRKAFSLDTSSIKFSDNYYTNSKDNYYYNYSDNSFVLNSVYVSASIKTNGSYAKSISPATVKNKKIEFDKAYLELGNTGKKIYSSTNSAQTFNGTTFMLLFPYNLGDDSENGGVRLVIENARFKPGVSDTEYVLWDENKKEDCIDKNSKKTVFTYDKSTHKVDAKLPEVTLETSDGSNVADWHKQLDFSAVPSEKIRADIYGNGTLYDNYALMELYSGNNEKVKIYNSRGESTSSEPAAVMQKVPMAANSKTDIALKLYDKTEGEYTLKLSGVDIAGNKFTKTIEQVHLDNKPPVVELTQQVEQADGSITYNAKISDASGTGKLYYCFTDGNMPTLDKNGASKNESGYIDSLINKWAFIDQSDTENGGAAVHIQIEKGKSFSGYLTYMAEDKFGNATDYSSIQINLDNEDSECKIVALDGDDKPLSSRKIAINTNTNNKVYYAWEKPSIKGEDNGYTTDYMPYSGVIDTAQNAETAKFDGTYTIKAKVVTPSGKEYYSQKSLAFDNTAPSVNTTLLTPDTFAANQTISVYSTDISGVKEGYAQIVSPDGNAIDGFEEFNFAVNDGIISQNVNISDISSGAYMLKIRVIDLNDIEAVVNTPVFYIRNQKIESQVNVTANYEINDVPLADNGAFNIEISAREEFKNADASQNQALYYRVSDNPDVFGEWIKGADMTADGEKFTADITVDGSNYSLIDGLNTLYVQTAVFTAGGNTEQININNVSTNEITLYGDTIAPTAYIVKEDVHTSQNIEAKLYTDDNLSGVTVECADANVQISQTEEGTGEYTITVLANVDTSVTVRDAAGNKTEVPLVINGIDTFAPETEIVSTQQKQAGAREDSYMTIKVKGVQNKGVQFAFIPESEKESAYVDGKINDKYFDDGYDDEIITVNLLRSDASVWEDEYDETYSIRLAGVTGTYYVGVRAEDSVGNSSDTILGETLSAKNADLEYTYNAAPPLAGTRAAVKVKFNIPVFVLDQSLVTDTVDSAAPDVTVEDINLETAKRVANTFTTEYTFVISRNGDHTLYTVDDIGRKKAITLSVGEDMVKFGQLKGLTAVTKVKNEDGSYRELKDGEMASAGGDAIVEVSADEPDLRVMHIDYGESGLTFDPDKSEPYKDTVGYTKLVYIVGENSIFDSEGMWAGAVQSNERVLNVNIFHKDETDSQMWGESMVVIDDIDNTSPEVSIKTSPEIYTLDEDGNIADIIYTPSNVVITVKMQDKDSGIVKIYPGTVMKEYMDEGEEHKYCDLPEIDLVDSEGNPRDFTQNPWKYDCSSEGIDVKVELHGDDNLKGEKLLVFTFGDNYVVGGTMCISGAGDMAMAMMDREQISTLDSIYKMPIEENTDYTVEYYMENADGDWVKTEDNTAYCSRAKAVINIAQRGETRGLYVKNNGGSSEKILGSFQPSYTFQLRDKYGYTKDVTVEVKNFDTTAPDIDYVLENTAKTNAPYNVNITADDDESGVEKVILTSGGIEIPLTQSSNIYTGKISQNGTYSIVAYDKTGNRSSKNFSVSNINMQQPKITERIYSIPKTDDKTTTSKSVSVTYLFDKPNVRIKSVDAMNGFDESKYSVNYSASQITFNESGSLGIYFVDEYGNELRDVETIDYIDKTPPQLDAVATVNTTKTTVSVTFKKTIDPVTDKPLDSRRELSDIMISYGGMIQVADKAQYDFCENGFYTFKIYDSEGLTTNLTVEIKDIDTTAPKITEIKWSYESDVFQDGKWSDTPQTNEKTISPNGKAGYRASRDLYPVTNNDVTVTVTTDSPTRLVGSDGEYSNTFTKTYTDNGMFIFNMQKNNLLADVFGLDIQFIDKTPPVIDLLGKSELVYYENPGMGSVFNADDVIKRGVAFEASDNITKADKLNVEIIDWGGFDYTDINNNIFDSSNPYTITYSVSDEAHNVTEAKRTIRLVGMYDTIALVNGSLPDYTGRSDVKGDTVTITLKNFPTDGIAYVRYADGVKTMGEMKTIGTQLTKNENGEFTVSGLENGWYTFFVQTDRRDYFTLSVYVYE